LLCSSWLKPCFFVEALLLFLLFQVGSFQIYLFDALQKQLFLVMPKEFGIIQKKAISFKDYKFH